MFRDRVLQHYREKGYTLRERVKVRGQTGAVHACDLVAQGPLGNLVIQFEDYGGFEGPELEAVRRIARDVGAVPVVAAEVVGDTIRRHAERQGVVILDGPALEISQPAEAIMTPTGAVEYPPWPTLDRPLRSRSSESEQGVADAKTSTTAEWPVDGRSLVKRSAPMDPGDVDALVSEWSQQEVPSHSRRKDPGFWQYDRSSASSAPKAESTEAPDEAEAQEAPKSGFGWLQETRAEDANGMPIRTAPMVRARSNEPLPHEVKPFTAPMSNMQSQQSAKAIAAAERRRNLARTLVGYAIAGACAGGAFLGVGIFFGAF